MTVAASDRAPESLAADAAQPLRGELEALLGADRVLGRASDIVRYASDASPYRLLPQVVVMARDAGDVAKALAYGRANDVPVVFRAGGTSRRRLRPKAAPTASSAAQTPPMGRKVTSDWTFRPIGG